MEGLYVVFLLFAVLVLPAMISYYLAREKNRPPLGWVFLTLIFSWPIVLAMIFFIKGPDAPEPGKAGTMRSADGI